MLPRVIPVLLLNRRRQAVKTVRFGSPRYLGDPINAIRVFNDLGADELVILDIEATRDGRAPDMDLIRDLASESFMPVAYGGGLRNAAEVDAVLRSGIEKVVLTSRVGDAHLVRQAASKHGAQSLVAGFDVVRDQGGFLRTYDHVARRPRPDLLADRVEEAVRSGFGEVFVQSVDRDGMRSGYDLPMVHDIAARIDVPLTVCGGAGSLEDLGKAHAAGAMGLAAGSLFVFKGARQGVLVHYPAESEKERALTRPAP